jgi:hypothetical protein
MMIRKKLYRELLVCGFALGFATSAQAVFYTEDSNVDLFSGTNGSINKLLNIHFISGTGGVVFTNTWQRVSNNDADPRIGDRVVSIFASQVNTAQNGGPFNPIYWRDDAQSSLESVIFLGGIEGTIIEQNLNTGEFVLQITTGRLGLTAVPIDATGLTTYQRRDVQTWGLGTSDASGNFTAQQNLLAEWTLKPQELVTSGFGSQIPSVIPSEVNTSALNRNQAATDTSGNALYREDTNNGPEGSTYFRTGAPGDDLVNLTTNAAGEPYIDEGIFLTFKQNIEIRDLTTATVSGDVPALGLTATPSGFNDESPDLWANRVAQLATMNAIANWSGAGGVTGFGFATAFAQFDGNPNNNTVSQWTPGFLGNPGARFNATGDFRATATQVTAYPGGQIPEPATLALLGIGLLGMGFASAKKRQKV